MVEVEQSTKTLSPYNATYNSASGFVRSNDLMIQAPMHPFGVIV